MRILYTSHQFFPDFGAGTEILTYQTAKEAQRRGWDVRVLTTRPVRNGGEDVLKRVDEYEYDGIPVVRFHHSNRCSVSPKNPVEAEYRNRYFARRFREVAADFKPEVIHGYHLQRLSLSLVEEAWALGIPLIFTATDFWLMCPTNQLLTSDADLCLGPRGDGANCLKHMAHIAGGGRAGGLLNRIPERLLSIPMALCRRLPMSGLPYISMVQALARRREYVIRQTGRMYRILTATRFMKDLLVGYGVDAHRVVRQSFGFRTHTEGFVVEKGGEKALRVGFIGTLFYHKGAHILLEAVKRLSEETVLTVDVYGSMDLFPEYTDRLRRLAGSDSRIRFRGEFPNRDIGSVLSQMDVLIVPSLWYENTPLVIHGALAAGVPVAASNLGGIREVVVDGKNGMLFDAGDAVGLAGILGRLYTDRDLLRRLAAGCEGPKPLETYVDELENMYRGAIAGD